MSYNKKKNTNNNTTTSTSSTYQKITSDYNDEIIEESTYNKIKRIVRKCITPNLQPAPDDFPELGDVIIWIRFIIGLTYGLYIGTNVITTNVDTSTTKNNNYNTMYILLHGLNLLMLVPIMYCRLYLNVYKTLFIKEIMFSGLLNSIALILLIWIYYCTYYHSNEELLLNNLLLNASDTTTSTTTATITETINTINVNNNNDEQEF